MTLKRFIRTRKRECQKLALWLRGPFVRRQQNRLAEEMRLADCRRLILFFFPSVLDCCGGMMSIASLAAESRRLNPDAIVLCTTYPGEQTALGNESFPNDEKLIRFPLVCSVARPEELIVHIPEVHAARFHDILNETQRQWMKSVPKVQINILNQNVTGMSPRAKWENLFELADSITQTTAHDQYATQEVCDRYGIPLHHFSVHLNTDGWPFRAFHEKEKLIVISPDTNPGRGKVLAALRRGLPDYQIREVKDMRFQDYLKLISRARASITFGEGMDFFFMDPVRVGSIGIAVYNTTFFPSSKWLELDNVYPDYDALASGIAGDIRRLERDPSGYERIRQQELAMIEEVYSYAEYSDNLKRFYKRQYDFMPAVKEGGR